MITSIKKSHKQKLNTSPWVIIYKFIIGNNYKYLLIGTSMYLIEK